MSAEGVPLTTFSTFEEYVAANWPEQIRTMYPMDDSMWEDDWKAWNAGRASRDAEVEALRTALERIKGMTEPFGLEWGDRDINRLATKALGGIEPRGEAVG